MNNEKGFLPIFPQCSLQSLVTMQGNHFSQSVTSKMLILFKMFYF